MTSSKKQSPNQRGKMIEELWAALLEYDEFKDYLENFIEEESNAKAKRQIAYLREEIRRSTGVGDKPQDIVEVYVSGFDNFIKRTKFAPNIWGNEKNTSTYHTF